MKNLILTISLFASLSFFAQPQWNDNTVNVSDTEDEYPFDFNTKDYLPLGFDPYEGMIIDESNLLIEEPVVFDFDTNAYLPEGFDPYEGMFKYKMVWNEEQVKFNFDTKKYLPKKFDPYKKVSAKVNPAI